MSIKGISDIYPASYLQIGMLLESEQGVQGTYHDVFRYRINAVFEEERFVRLIRQLVNKHELLRAKFLLSDNGYDCVIQEEIDPDIRVVESEDPEPIIEEERLNTFDFKRAGLFRMVVNRLPEQYDLIFSFHHAITDGWSVASLINEFITAYTGGREITGKVKLHYGEFVMKERQWLKNVEAENFWKGYLSDSDVGQVKWKNSTARSGSGIFMADFRLEEERARAVHQLAHSLQVTVDTVFLYVYINTLSRFLNQEDITIGLVTNNRIEKEDGDKLFGLFLNTVPYRYQVNGRGMNHKTDIAKMFDEKLKLYQYKGYPYGKIKSLMGRELYQFAFNFVHFHIYAESRKDIVGGSGYERTSIPFTLNIFQYGDNGFAVALRGHEEVSDQEHLDAFMRHYEYHLNCLLGGKADFTQIPEAEYKQLLGEWKGTEVKYAGSKTIQGLFEEQVERTPDTIAVVFEGIELTYKELNERSNQLANYLLEQYNIQPDDLVCLCMNRSEQLLIAILGVLKAGGAYVPLDPSTPEERLEYIIEDTGTKVVLRGRLPEVSGYPDFNPQTKTGAGNLAYVIYTSGTTGRPKGVMVEQRGVVNYLFNVRAFIGEEINRVDLSGNVAFDMAVTTTLFPLCFGKMIYIYAGDITNISDYEQHLIQNRIELLKATPGYLSVLAHQVDGRNEFALKVIIAGGEKLHGRQINSLLNLTETIIDEYGPTETTVGATAYMINKEVDQYSIGKAYANYTVYVLSKENKVLPVGAVGELYIGGAGVARGYLNQAALTAERFVVNPFQTDEEKRMGINDRLYRTGDLVRWLANGNLEYLGRNDQQVKLRGYRIELGEIESRLSSYPGVLQSVAVLKGMENDHPYLAGYYVSRESISEKELLQYLSAGLPEYMAPSVLIRLEELPLTVNGKLDLKKLPDPELSAIREHYEGPGDELERKLCVIYGEVLAQKADTVGVKDDFFRLGGNSILAIKLVSYINRELGTELRATTIFRYRTIQKLAIHIREGISGEVRISAPAVNTVEEQALSFAQERLWFIQAFEGASRAYNIPMVVRLLGNVESVVLALQSVVQRHEVLRTLILTNEAGVGYQQVMNDREMPLEIPRQELPSEEALRTELAREGSGIFQLDREYPIRVKLYQVQGKTGWYLSVVLHHIAFDEWSGDVFLHELEQGYQYYEAVRLQQPEKAKGLELPAPVLQYREFALWQRGYLTGEVLERQVGYWRKKLAGYEPLQLATDHPRPLQVNYEGATINFELSREVSEGLRVVARELEVSLYSVLLSGYYVLLSTYSNQKDIVVGSAVANRHYGELSGMIGFFVNMLAMRGHVDSDQKVTAFIRRIGESVLDAQLHQDLPFEKLVEELEVEQDPSRHPVFQVTFDLGQRVGGSGITDGGKGLWEWYGGGSGPGTAKFDLSVTMEDRGGQLRGEFNYATALFNEVTIWSYIETYREILGQLSSLLKDALARNKRIGELCFLNEKQYKEVVEEWNRTEMEYPSSKTFQALFEEQVERTPDNIAVVYEGVKLTYKELNERSNQLAQYLLEQYNIQPDELVCLCMQRSEAIPIAILGVMKAGGAYVPIDPATPEERLQYILQDTKAKLMLKGALPELSRYPINNPQTKTGADNLAYVIYTSGTTGRPKGVMVEHRGLINLARGLSARYELSEHETVLQLANYVFDSSIEQVALALLGGHTLLMVSTGSWEDLVSFGKLLTDSRVTYIDGTPSLLEQLPLLNLPHLRAVSAGGEPLSKSLLQQSKNAHYKLINSYGPTEATVTCVVNVRAETTSIGRPIWNTTVYVLDEERRLLPVGAVGELYIGGAGIARGYLNQAELTAERFLSNPFQTEGERRRGVNGRLYRTGDLVRWLADGSLEYLGRNDQQVKLRGYRIELGEIESRLSSYPGVRQSVVVVKGETGGQPYLAGYYVSEKEIEEETLLRYLRQGLPDFMVPSVLMWLEELPLTVSGKLDRRALPDPVISFTSGRYEAPGDELERKLCGIYAEVLQLKAGAVGVKDDFFRLGGNSILAMRLVSRINRELGTGVRVTAIFLHRTIRQLCNHLREGVSGEVRISAPAVNTVEEQALSFAQERLWFIENYEAGSRAYNIPMAVRLSGNVELESVVLALRSVVHRHEVLRTLIRTSREGIGYQQVMNDEDMPLEIGRVELSSEEDLQAELQREGSGIFRLDREYPIRLKMYRVEGKTDWYLSVVLHHIAFDEWSGNIFLSELEQSYRYQEAVRLGELEKAKGLMLPAPALQYREFALWQRGYLTGDVLVGQVGYWRERLAGYESLRLPTDYPRPMQVSYEGATISFQLNGEVSEGLSGVAQELEVSLYSVLLSGYYVLLSAYSNQTDIIVGSAVANRHYGELSDVIGFFVNMLAMRGQVEADQELAAFIRQVGRSVVEAQLHQDLPFEKLVEELRVEQDPSRHPVFQVTFSLIQAKNNKRIDSGEEGLWEQYGGGVGLGVAKFDMSVIIEEREGQLYGEINYATGLFEEGTIRSYMETYQKILGQISSWWKDGAAPHKRVSEFHYLGESEQAQLTGEWKERDVTYASNRTIQSLFEEQVERTPDTTAVIYEGVALTYKELNERSNQLANYLLEQYNLQPDELVCLCLDRNEQLLIGILGVLKAGGAYVPMEPGSPEERLEYIMQDTGSKVVLRGALPDVSDCSDINPQTKTGADNLAYVIYTSGTTGKPKGVMVEHRQVARLFSATEEWYYFTSEDVWTLFHSYVFDFSVWEIWGALLYGGRLVVVGEEQRLDPVLFYEMCKDHGVTVLNQTPSAFYPWMEVAVGRSERLEKLRYIIFGGEALNPGQLRPWFDHYGEWGPKVINMYGITETTVHVTYQEITGAELNRGSLIGQPIGDLSAYVLDAAGRLLPIGAIGELYVGGAGVARGYLNRSALTAERFVSNRFQTEDEKRLGINDRLYRTGDLVRWRTDGNLEYLGRNDQQVKLRGYRIELGEIESRLSSYPGVRQSVVVMKGEATDHPYLVGYYVSDGAVNEEELLPYLSAVLPDYMVPSALMRLEVFPVTVNGKLDRDALPEPKLTNASRYEAPGNELEQKLCAIYGEVLGLKAEEIGVHDDFFRLGGDSIIAIRLVSKINQELQKELSVRDVFELKSIRPIGNLLMNTNEAAVQASYQPFSLMEPGKYTATDMEGVSDIYPASYLQIGMLLESKQGVKGTYHDVFRYRINAVFEEERFVRLIRQLANKHELLRAKFLLSDNGYDCVIQNEIDPDIKVLEGANPASIVGEERLNDFDFKRAGLFRMVVNRLPEQYDLVFSFHHAIVDGWSVASLMNEFLSAYTGGWDITGEMGLRYGEFIANERQWLKNAEAENFWKNYLSGNDAGYVRWKNSTVKSESGLFLARFRLDGEGNRAVHQLAQSMQVTVDSVFLYAYINTLSRFLNQEDITVGLVTNNRIEKEDGDKLIGLFLNTVPYRYHVKAHGMDHRANITEVFGEKLKLYQYKGYPYGKIKSLMGREMYQFAFNFVHFHIFEESKKDIVGGDGYERSSIPFTLTVFQYGDDGFTVTLRGHEEVSDQQHLDAFMRLFNYYLNELLYGKADFTQIPEAEKVQLLGEWKSGEGKCPANKTIQSLFEEQVDRTPDNIALIYENVKLTYKELNERSNQLAHYLLEQYNIQPDDLVCLCMDRSEQLLIAMLGVLKAGGAYVPLDPVMAEERLEYILQDTGSKVVLRNALPDLSGFPAINPQTKNGAGDLAYVIYTSGTTGRPKGVMVEHKALTDYLYGIREKTNITACKSFGLVQSVTFDSVATVIYSSLLTGGKLHIFSDLDARDGEKMLAADLDCLKIIPSHWKVLQEGNRLFVPAKCLIFGGESLTKDVIDLLKNRDISCEIYNHYGPTEATVGRLIQRIDLTVDDKEIPLGYPIGESQVYILDEYDNLLPSGAVGEIVIQSADGLARGYLNLPELTAKKFIPSPFRPGVRLYRTGDLGKRLFDGSIVYLGRNDQQVKLRGYRIELGEIEARLSLYPGMQQTVVEVKGADGHPFLVGYYVSREAISEEQLIQYLRAGLPEYMVPSVLMRIEELPLTVNGKLDRKALPDPVLPVSGLGNEGPGDELERKLCGIYGSVLGLPAEEIGVHDDFFRLGGDSIAGIQLVGRINRELETGIGVTAILVHRTIRQMCVHLREGVSGEVKISAAKVSEVEEQALSFAQERLWFIESYEGGSRAYNIPIAVRLLGNVEVESVMLALRSVVHRHEVLRTLIRTNEAGVGYQQVMDDEAMPLEIFRIELSSEEALQLELEREASGIFRLDREYPIRLKLYQVQGDANWYLSIVLHHIAFDGWSGDIFLRELEQGYRYYEAVRLGQPEKAKGFELPAPVLQYREFALWQRGYLTGEVLELQVGYWRQKLAGHEPLRLATDRVRPPQVSYVGAAVYFELSPEMSEGLRQVAQELEVSLYSVLLSGYYVLLSAYSNQTDIIVGSAVANRHYGELSGLIGFFVNMLAMREQVDGDQELAAFIRQVGRSVVEAQLHQDLPFEKLVEELRLEQDPSRHPMFQVTFDLDQGGARAGGAGSGDRLWQPYGGSDGLGVAKFDLSLMMLEKEGQLRGMFNYATSLFEEGTIRSYVETYRQILDQISNLLKEAAGRSKRIVELQYLGVREQERLLGEWKGKTFAYSSNKTIQALFEEQVERTPDNIAVVYEGVKLTYKELNEQSNQLANYLLEQYNIQPDELVCLCLDRSEQQLIGMLGVLKSGGAYVPIDPATPEERLAYIIQDTGSKVVLRGGLPQVSGYATINPQTKTGANDLAYVIYTSGTTGRPKGVMVEHRGVVNLAMMQALEYGLKINEGTVYHQNCLWYSNYVFDAHVWEIYTTLIHGHSLYIIDNGRRTDIRLLQEYIREHAITIATIPPAVLDTDHILGLKILTAAGEITSSRIMERYVKQQVNMINAYGPTETTVCATCHYYQAGNSNREIGRPLPNITVYVLDGDCRPLPVGAVGELYVGGAGVARGYLNQAELTAERFVANRFQTEEEKRLGINARLYRTGDLVRWLSNGSLEYIGRNDHQVKLRGYRIELGEIESRLSLYPGVQQSVVEVKVTKGGLYYLAAYYAGKEGIEEALLQYLREGLPEHMVPSVLMRLEQLPVTVNGKLDRKALPTVEIKDNTRYEAPGDEVEKKLAEIYGEVLGLSEVGVNDDYFQLGGDSIVSIQLVSRIRKWLGVYVGVKDIFTHRTVRELYRQVIAGAIAGGMEQLSEDGQLEGESGLLPIQKWFFAQVNQDVYRDYNHFNHSFLINVPRLNREILEESIRKLAEYHDSLRFSYVREEVAGGYEYRQYYRRELEGVTLRYVNRDKMAGPEELFAVFTEWQNDFNILGGKLWQAGYVEGFEDRRARVFFAIHHLLIDTVSWRILTEDLQRIYERLELVAETGREWKLIPVREILGKKGSSYRQWAETITGYAQRNPSEAGYWRSVINDCSKTTETLKSFIWDGDINKEQFILDKPATHKLLISSSAYHTEINHLLLTALALSIRDLTGNETCHISLEGHGREEVDDQADMYRTVGWFTTMFPVRLTVKGNETGELIKRVKESIRSIPNKGLGYGALVENSFHDTPKISFNYLGQFGSGNSRPSEMGVADITPAENEHWFITSEASGQSSGPRNSDHNVITINCRIIGGELKVGITTRMNKLRTNQLKEAFNQSLLEVIGHCAGKVKPEYTPSDFTAGFNPYVIANATPYGNKKILFMLPPAGVHGEFYADNLVPGLRSFGTVAFNNYHLHISTTFSKEQYNDIGYEFLAEYYVRQIKQIQPEGPYYLFGVSSGGVVAFEIARQLTEMGDRVEKLVLLDSYFNMSQDHIKAMMVRPDESINCRYNPPVRNKFAGNIILFKADRAQKGAEDHEFVKYYVSTPDNHLSDLVGTDNLTVVLMNQTHSSWQKSKKWITKISAACRLDK